MAHSRCSGNMCGVNGGKMEESEGQEEKVEGEGESGGISHY